MPSLTPEMLMGFTFASSAIAGIGTSVSQAISTRALGESQRKTFEINQRFANLQAEDAIKRGDTEAGRHAQKVKRIIGAQRAAIAGQGIEVDTGSALDVQAETAEFGAIDVETIRNNAYREAWGYRTQALDYGAKGQFASLEAKATARNTLLTGGLNTLNLATQYYGYRYGYGTKTTTTTTGPVIT